VDQVADEILTQEVVGEARLDLAGGVESLLPLGGQLKRQAGYSPFPRRCRLRLFAFGRVSSPIPMAGQLLNGNERIGPIDG
jgi:hypothetical protein